MNLFNKYPPPKGVVAAVLTTELVGDLLSFHAMVVRSTYGKKNRSAFMFSTSDTKSVALLLLEHEKDATDTWPDADLQSVKYALSVLQQELPVYTQLTLVVTQLLAADVDSVLSRPVNITLEKDLIND